MGRVRCEMGRPESFHLKYLTIGNEEVGTGYLERYEMILQAIREKYPEIQVINSAIMGIWEGKQEDGWEHALRTKSDCWDEHMYQFPEWFLVNTDRYERFSDGPRAFLGEYSARDDTWENALAEAAFLTGFEKSPYTGFACYAPLLNHVSYSNWKPDLIHFDNHRCFGTPSYYVQKLFMSNQGIRLLACEVNGVEDGTSDGSTAGKSGRCRSLRLKKRTEKCFAEGSIRRNMKSVFHFVRKSVAGRRQ
ncbi:MAG: hypothetical protein IJ468_15610 [Lachnospiraceae bacterium]|nr:hypothetical protein [Lachnospiraceae bacterium]